MVLSQEEKIKLKLFIKKLESIKGRHTELVSVYIPAGYNLNNILDHLYQERGTAENIKSTTTRKNVISALERMIQYLKLFQKTPPNGLAVFSGNVSEVEGRPDIEVFSIEPPVPLNKRIYRCDKQFVLDPLKEILQQEDEYGLIVVDKREATIGLLRGKSISVLAKLKSAVPGKTRAGGQCLSKDTNVFVSHSSVPITHIQIGDSILGVNLNSKEISNAEVIDYWNTKISKYVIITAGPYKIKCSLDHLIFIEKNNKFLQVAAENIKIGDKLIALVAEQESSNISTKRNDKTNKNKKTKSERDTRNGKAKSFVLVPVEVNNIEIKEGVMDMIDISTTTSSFFANNILVHNSAQRFERVREGLTKDFYREIGQKVKELFLNRDLKGIIVGGPGPTKNDFIENASLPENIKRKIIAIKDISYTDEFGLHELVEKSQDVLSEEEISEERAVMTKFLHLLAKDPEKVAYGEEEVIKHLEAGAVEVLLLSDAIGEEKITKLMDKAQEFSTKVKVISTSTREGVQLKEIGGYGAILRYGLS